LYVVHVSALRRGVAMCEALGCLVFVALRQELRIAAAA
jgi:hypothetical protein